MVDVQSATQKPNGVSAKPMKPETATGTSVDTVMLRAADIAKWRSPSFQRPLSRTAKLKECADKIRTDGGVIPGVISLGILPGSTILWILDGQHRIEAWKQSGCEFFYADIRTVRCASEAEMGIEFDQLNGHLANLKPDDILRAIEASSLALTKIKQACNFIGYDHVRRGVGEVPMVSMSAALRCWRSGTAEVPTSAVGSASKLAKELTLDEADGLIGFMALCFRSWQRDPEWHALWKNLNLSLCAWLYRRTVLQPATAQSRSVRLNKELFGKCLTSLTASGAYMEYLVGRTLSERDRAPTYDRIKKLFAKRIEQEIQKKALLPSPAWAHGSARR